MFSESVLRTVCISCWTSSTSFEWRCRGVAVKLQIYGATYVNTGHYYLTNHTSLNNFMKTFEHVVLTSCRDSLSSGFLRLPRAVAVPLATFQHARVMLSYSESCCHFIYELLKIILHHLVNMMRVGVRVPYVGFHRYHGVMQDLDCVVVVRYCQLLLLRVIYF